MTKIEPHKLFVPMTTFFLVLGVVASGAWRAAERNSKIDETAAAVNELKAIVPIVAAIRTDIEVIRVKVQAMERPISRTSRNVRSIKRDVQFFKLGPLYARPFNPGPEKASN